MNRLTKGRPIVLAAILALGVLAVWMFANAMAKSVLDQWSAPAVWENLVITPGGELYISQYDGRGGPNTYRTLDGKPVPLGREIESNYTGALPAEAAEPYYDLSWWTRIVGFNDALTPPTYWYLVLDNAANGEAFFVGYNGDSKMPIGFIGARGFRADEPPEEEQFSLNVALLPYQYAGGANAGREPYRYSAPDEWSGIVFINSRGKLRIIDLNHRSVKPFEANGEVISIGLASQNEARNSSVRILARTKDRFIVLNYDGELERAIPVPDSLRARDVALYNWWSDTPIFVDDPYFREPVTTIYRLDAHGAVAKQEQVRLARGKPESLEQGCWMTSLVVPSPAILAIALFVLAPIHRLYNHQEPDLTTALSHVTAAGWLPFLVICLLSAAVAVWCYRRHRRYSDSGALTWAIFVFLTGLPGYIGYLLHRRWPVTEKCPRCGEVTPRDRDSCLNCAAEFPLPAMKGIEIFA